jgi:pimeloyl-ACP methyl ester carboxylesterase
MRQISDALDAASRASTLLVLLPPAEARIEDLQAQGFVLAVRRRGIRADIVLAELTYEHLMTKTAVSTLHQHVVLPARADGYRDIWLAGISLGGFNALHYAGEHAQHVSGLHLMSPYPGTADVLAEISGAGGPLAWAATASSGQGDERTWWRWLCGQARAARWPTAVYLSTGTEDRFRDGQRMLAGLLPAPNVHWVPGGHAWPAWHAMWVHWLRAGPLSTPGSATAGR